MDLQTYERTGRSIYEKFSKTVARILQIAAPDIPSLRIQHVQFRAKDPDSLRKKLRREGAEDSSEIEKFAKDLAGARLVLYTNSDVSRFQNSGLLQNNFDIDWTRSKAHFPTSENPSAPELFDSINYVVSLKADRLALPEYLRFAGLSCEVQVQTTLNHAWAEMAHDTIYKKPELLGFGDARMEGIESRMAGIMRKYLAPAGYEFQKVLSDFESLQAGAEFFEAGPLSALRECKDNNELYETMDRFTKLVIPLYNDPYKVADEIFIVMESCVHLARGFKVLPIQTPFGSFDGYDPEDVITKIAEIIRHFRYVDPSNTLTTLIGFYVTSETIAESACWVQTAAKLAHHDMETWRRVGPHVQRILVQHIASLPVELRSKIRQLALGILDEVLHLEVTGVSSSTFDAIQIHQGIVLPSDELKLVRETALDILFEYFDTAENDRDRRDIIEIFNRATAFRHYDTIDNSLLNMLLEDAQRILHVYLDHSAGLSFSLLQSIEDDLLRVFQFCRSLVGCVDTTPTTVALSVELIRCIERFRDQINSIPDYYRFKALVGFESVFPLHWEEPELSFEEEQTYHQQIIDELVSSVDEASVENWLRTLTQFAGTKSNDLATFLPFSSFLEKVGSNRPNAGILFLEGMNPELARFLTPLLNGLSTTPSWPAAKALVEGYILSRRFLPAVSWCFRNVSGIDGDLAPRILEGALESDDRATCCHLIAAVAYRNDPLHKGVLKECLLRSAEFLSSRSDTSWVETFWVRGESDGVLGSLSEVEASCLLRLLVPHQSFSHQSESFLAQIAKIHPKAIFAFFRVRAKYRSSVPSTGYEVFPHPLYELPKVLSRDPGVVISEGLSWYSDADGPISYYGTKLIHEIFPDFSDELSECLLKLIAEGTRPEIEFVVRSLRAYTGQDFLWPICKEVVASLTPDDELLQIVELILESQGVTTGVFGHANGLKKKLEALETWEHDERESVQLFSRHVIHFLKNLQIPGEFKRAKEDLAFQKMEYGSPGEVAD